MKKLNYFFILLFLIIPAQAQAAGNNNGDFDFSALGNFIKLILSIAFAVAPILIMGSFAVSILVWVTSGTSKKRLQWAQKQFIATLVVVFVLGAYFSIKTIILDIVLA